MRSRMLGLAIALSTFGLGVTATTVWIAHHTPARANLERKRAALVNVSSHDDEATGDDSRCKSKYPTVVWREPELVSTWSLAVAPEELSKSAKTGMSAGKRAHPVKSIIVSVVLNGCGEVQDVHAYAGNAALRAKSYIEYIFKRNSTDTDSLSNSAASAGH